MPSHRFTHITLRMFILTLLAGACLLPGLVMAQDDAEAHKAVIRQLFDEAYNAGNLDIMDELYAPDYLNHGYGDDLTLETYQAAIAAMQAALTDFHAEIEVLIAEDDWAASRVVFSGTFENAWVMGEETIEPNEEPVEWTLNILHRFDENDKMVEDFTAFDSLGLLVQLDASPVAPALVNLVSPLQRTPAVMEESAPENAAAMHDVYQEMFTCVIEDAINNGELDAIDTCMGEDHAAHEPFGDLTRDQFKTAIGGFRGLVPDLHVDIEALVIEGNWLAARLNYIGTFSNPITIGPVTIQPTGKPVSFIVNVFVHYDADGKSIEDFKEYNRLGWARQVGLLPPAS
jgi:predicted ester cyclase